MVNSWNDSPPNFNRLSRILGSIAIAGCGADIPDILNLDTLESENTALAIRTDQLEKKVDMKSRDGVAGLCRYAGYDVSIKYPRHAGTEKVYTYPGERELDGWDEEKWNGLSHCWFAFRLAMVSISSNQVSANR